MLLVKQSDTSKKVLIFMADSTTPTAGKTGLSPSVRISKNGAAFAGGGGTVAELEGGFYAYTPAAADFDTLGPLGIRATATGAVDFAGVRQVVPFDPYNATSLGLGNLDAAITTRMATYTQPTGFLAATFPGTVASPTNITAGTITTTTNLTNLPAAPTDWLSAAAVKADAVTKIQAGLSTYAGGVVASVSGDVGGKVLGGGTGTIAGVGARVTDGSGNALGTATGQAAILTDTGSLVSRLGTPTGVSIAADLGVIAAYVDSVEGRLPAALVDGRIDASVGAVATGPMTAVVDAVWAKAMTELAAVPGVNATTLEALQWLFLLSRNRYEDTSSTQTLRNDADTADIATSVNADDGTLFTRGKWS